LFLMLICCTASHFGESRLISAGYHLTHTGSEPASIELPA